MQKWLEDNKKIWQENRAKLQMTLGDLINALEIVSFNTRIIGFGKPDSYRGYYEDLAFEYSEHEQSAAEFLKICRECVGKTFMGYKGGDYVMHLETPIWMADWGETGMKIIGLNFLNGVMKPDLERDE